MTLWKRSGDTETPFHVYQHGTGTGQTRKSLLLAGLEWVSDAATGTGAIRSSGGACRLEWRGAHAAIRPDARPKGLDLHETGQDGEPCGSLLAQMCLALEREMVQSGHQAGLSHA